MHRPRIMHLPDLSLISTDRIPASFIKSELPVDVLRLDKVHDVISGNKWFKLHKYLEIAQAEKKSRIISFGGPWSNHIIAVAAAARIYGYASMGFIRGEKNEPFTPILQQCQDWGMELCFLDRSEFDQEKFPERMIKEDDLLIPMGGYGIQGMEGAGTILDHCRQQDYTHICCATGTGTMMAGLLNKITADQTVIGFSAVKNDPVLEDHIRKLLPDYRGPVLFETDKRFGGFARYNEELINFMNELFEASSIPTDIVYTAKLCYAVIHKIRAGEFAAGSRVLIIHSGGLTGNYSVKNGLLIM